MDLYTAYHGGRLHARAICHCRGQQWCISRMLCTNTMLDAARSWSRGPPGMQAPPLCSTAPLQGCTHKTSQVGAWPYMAIHGHIWLNVHACACLMHSSWSTAPAPRHVLAPSLAVASPAQLVAPGIMSWHHQWLVQAVHSLYPLGLPAEPCSLSGLQHFCAMSHKCCRHDSHLHGGRPVRLASQQHRLRGPRQLPQRNPGQPDGQHPLLLPLRRPGASCVAVA